MDQESPRASFTSLPLEIKAYVVKLAREQDEAYGLRDRDALPAEGKVNSMRKPEWYGRSVNA